MFWSDSFFIVYFSPETYPTLTHNYLECPILIAFSSSNKNFVIFGHGQVTCHLKLGVLSRDWHGFYLLSKKLFFRNLGRIFFLFYFFIKIIFCLTDNVHVSYCSEILNFNWHVTCACRKWQKIYIFRVKWDQIRQLR